MPREPDSYPNYAPETSDDIMRNLQDFYNLQSVSPPNPYPGAVPPGQQGAYQDYVTHQGNLMSDYMEGVRMPEDPSIKAHRRRRR